MSDARDGIEPRRGNFASRKARGETGGCKTSASRSSGKNKEHSYDARRYHQNANRHGIHALRTFDCPVCDSKNTIRVTLNPRLGQGTVTCTYCCSLRPVPTDLPYPSVQAFVPSLENKADVFFRFNEQYAELLQLHMGGNVGGSSGPPSHSAAADSTRKRAGKDDGASDGPTRRPRAEDGLFGDYLPHIDTCLLSNTVDQHVIGATGMLVSDDDGGSDNVVDTNLANPKRVSTPSPPRLDGADVPESNFMSVAMITGVDEAVAEEADVAEFFADSD
ncbi:Transcription elongation factor Elf1 like, putative [Leishmania lindenbergi]|uniref:Transcription elongation factor Elf1 like n=1 Tax=Leishmania lindenbergi TaxID=651832 RepID=A0AAW3AJR1_9TRYP